MQNTSFDTQRGFWSERGFMSKGRSPGVWDSCILPCRFRSIVPTCGHYRPIPGLGALGIDDTIIHVRARSPTRQEVRPHPLYVHLNTRGASISRR
ncbi:hypothetical protein GGE12_005243 [Rhizobium mongolense]|uniref:Uncharacterized protein n=1 Tax=Rhizobium mongolense TaxID=57676 RepID=A0A7W6RRT2_9HYPH|nr:hypothetical protein [Rhizobium mongolense]